MVLYTASLACARNAPSLLAWNVKNYISAGEKLQEALIGLCSCPYEV